MLAGSTRIHGTGWREPIAVAHRIIGRNIMGRLGHVQYVCGVDPTFAGVHGFIDTADGRGYRETAHCAYPWHVAGPADRRVTTVVMPVAAPWKWRWTTPHLLVHELGHALHATIDFDHVAVPVTEYAKRNNFEAFAEAFVSWCWPGNGYDHPDPATVALFDSLAEGGW